MTNDIDKYLIDVLDSLADIYNRPPIGEKGSKIYIAMLSGYSIDQINYAFERHQRDPNEGAFFPKPANLLKHLEGDTITHDEVIAMSRLADTPLGILCRIKIGTYDLDNSNDHFYLKSRAAECLELLPEWKQRAKNGEFTEHEIKMMLKHKVNPSAPFYQGLPSPTCSDQINIKAKQIYNSDEFKQLIAPPDDDDGEVDQEGLKKIQKIVTEILN